MATKYAKAEVKYTGTGHPSSHCSLCRHWQSDGKCEIVAGKIAPGGWCEHFKPEK